jgi:uncharacterized membrane protein YfcA
MAASSKICILLLGFISGLLSSVAAGATLVVFPMLVFLGLSPVIANATAAFGILPACLGGIAGYRHHLSATTRWLRFFAPVSLAGGLIGAVLFTLTPAKIFDRLVPFLILFATLLIMFQGNVARLINPAMIPRAAKSPHKLWIGLILIQLAISIYGGYYGGGVSILMLSYFGFLDFGSIHEVNTVKLVLAFIMNLVAAIYFALYGLIDWPAALLLATGAFAGGWIGSQIAHKLTSSFLRWFIIITGLASAGQLFYLLWE